MNRSLRFYHSGETGDLAFVAQRIASDHPREPLFVVGYSLGGNVLLKWLGEEGRERPSQLRAAVAVSVPYDLEAGAGFIHQGFSRVYERHFLRTLKQKTAVKLQRFPGMVDPVALDAATSIVAFDEAVTARIHGFADAHDYYQRSSAIGFLTGIRLPTLLISAYDDPFLPPEILGRARALAAQNPSVTPCFSSHGGHVGFVAGDVPGRPVYYSEDRAMAFLSSHLEP